MLQIRAYEQPNMGYWLLAKLNRCAIPGYIPDLSYRSENNLNIVVFQGSGVSDIPTHLQLASGTSEKKDKIIFKICCTLSQNGVSYY